MQQNKEETAAAKNEDAVRIADALMPGISRLLMAAASLIEAEAAVRRRSASSIPAGPDDYDDMPMWMDEDIESGAPCMPASRPAPPPPARPAPAPAPRPAPAAVRPPAGRTA